MKRRKFIYAAGAAIGVLSFPGIAQAFGSEKKPPVFKNGETVCFIGDSITHNGQWHVHVANYFQTRFPKNKVRFVNVGISGDKASNVIQRYVDDIKPHQSDHAVIMLGMNDVTRRLYNTSTPSEDNQKKRKQDYLDYQANMDKLIRMVKESSCRSIILIKPSPYDQTASLQTENLPGVNDVLHDFGRILEELAEEHRTYLIDFHGPMTGISIKKQQIDPSFSFAPRDRVHPNALGHQLMAYLFLESLNAPDLISSVSVDAREKTATGENAAVSGLKIRDNQIEFDLLEKALPYPVQAVNLPVLNWVGAENKHNRQLMRIVSLSPGKWLLTIDGHEVGEYTMQELDEGINLAFNQSTPQYRQAKLVGDLYAKYCKLEVSYRDYLRINILLREKGIDIRDEHSVEAFFNTFPYREGNYATRYFVSLFLKYFDIKNQLQENKRDMKKLFDQVHKINQPAIHHYQLKKMD